MPVSVEYRTLFLFCYVFYHFAGAFIHHCSLFNSVGGTLLRVGSFVVMPAAFTALLHFVLAFTYPDTTVRYVLPFTDTFVACAVFTSSLLFI